MDAIPTTSIVLDAESILAAWDTSWSGGTITADTQPQGNISTGNCRKWFFYSQSWPESISSEECENMTHDEAVTIIVHAGKDGQKKLLKALFEEMNVDDLDEILKENGYTTVD
jgi:hypothetical protein